ncbi:MAG TPA: hypothetical protein ENN67_02745 [Firmicutes bacterium]|nr:hypothetical protein [Bacillota bacterium]
MSKSDTSEEAVFEAAIEAGADNVEDGGETWDIYSEYADFDRVRTAIKNAGFDIKNSELIMVPSTTVKVAGKDAQSTLRMMEDLEDNDDVQAVWANFDIDIKEMEAFGN